MSTIPNFMIIGAMKSATSTLQDQLINQDGIYMCNPKEPNFFSDDDQYNKGTDWYLGLFDEFPDDALIGEASTHYTKSPTYPYTVERLTKLLPKLKLIYVMRHPMDRLISHYIHEWSMGNYHCDINEAINEYHELIDYSRYYLQLTPYLKSYGQDNILPVFFDRLTSHPQEELERICKFLGYSNEPKWDDTLKAKNVSKKRIRKFPLYAIIVESKIATYLRKKFVPKKIRNSVKHYLRMDKRPSINSENIHMLQKIFDEDLLALGQLLGCEICCENFKDLTSSKEIGWKK